MNATTFATERIVGKFARDGVDAVGEPPGAKEQAAIGAAQPVHLGARRTAAPQADDVEPDQRGDRPKRKAERNDVVAARRHAAHHRAFADPHKLMNGGVAAKEGVIADR